MAELKDFMKRSASKLTDFVSEVATTPLWSRPSAQNLAAHASLMSQAPVEAYDKVMSEMYMQGNSPTHTAYINSLNARAEEQSSRALESIVSEGSPNDVEAAIQGYVGMPPQTQHEALEREAISAPMPHESLSAEEFRIDTGTRLREINERRSLLQEVMNEELAKNDSGVLGIAADIATMIVPMVGQRPTDQLMEELGRDGWGDTFESFVLNGEAKQELSQLLRNVPESQRLEMGYKLIEALNNSPNVVLFTENKIEKANLLRTLVEEGYYTDTDRWIDNTISVLDSSAVGAPLARLLGVGKAVRSASRGVSGIVSSMARRDSVKSPVAPHSASQALKDTNPDKYRSLHEAMLLDPTGEIAESAYGTSRINSIGHDIAGEVLQPFDIVKNKVDIPVKGPNITDANARVMDVATANGTVYLSEAERLGVTAKVINDFRGAVGIQPRTAMTREGTVTDGVTGEFSNNTVNIRAVYGTVDGGFTRGADIVVDSAGEARPFSAVDDAIERTKISLRHYGVDDSDISILVRDGEHFNPVPASLASRDLDNFLVQVNFPYRVVGDDIPLEQFNVKNNILDRIGAFTGNRQGSLQRHVLALSSMLRREAVGGASVGVDRGSLLAKEMLDLGQGFTDLYKDLPLPRKAALFEEIKRANFEGRMPDKARLISEGFEAGELKALDKWKEYWDTAFHLENRDKRLSLAGKGYQRVVNPNGTQLDAKPIAENMAAGVRRAYDVDTDSVITLSKQEVDDLYGNGGHFSSTMNEMNMGGEIVGGNGLPIIVRNQAQGTVSRGYRDWDNVLDYREGYFAVKYDAEYFIVRTERGADGVEYERAIALSGDFKSAEARRRQLASEGGTYRVRTDIKGEERDKLMDSVNLSGGRSAQRIRGERLEDATDVNSSGFDMQYVMNPVDSMVNTSRGLADRVAMREFMEVSKNRFLQQFGHMLPKNKFGQTLWPSKVEHIGRPGELASKELADARTTWEAINYWENGYINAMEDGWKAALRTMGNIAGMSGLTRAEKVAFWAAEQAGPATASRRLAFNLYLVLNPARQLIVQGHQSVQLAALRPAYIASQLSRDFPALTAARLANGTGNLPKALVQASGRSKEQLKDMYQAYINSGLSASIDRQNLVRGSLLNAADDLVHRDRAVGALASVGRGVNKTLNVSRRAGFDLGEEVNMMTSFLTFYDRALEANAGKKLSIEQLDDVTARARDFTYGMNFADDMPYNQNWLSMVFQFAQVPHKAAMQFTFNRALTPMEKVRIAAFNTVMYGVPPGSLLYSMIEPATAELPEELREVAIFGLESYALNATFSAIAGEDVKLSYNALQATDTITMANLVESLMTMDAMELIANSPSGSLMFGPNPKLTEWARTVMKFTNFIDEDSLDRTDLPVVIKQTFGLSSGFSNAFKARLAYKMNEKTNAYGKTTKDGVSLAEAIGTALGFETQHEMLMRNTSTEVYEKSKAFEDDVKEQYRLTKLQLHRIGKDIRDADHAVEVMQFGWLAFEDSPRAKEIWRGLMQRDLTAGDHVMFNTLLKAQTGGVMSPEEVRHFVRGLPDGETKQGLTQILDDLDELKELR